jgi:fructoselysine-6-P-deglycase FrlB-like protein
VSNVAQSAQGAGLAAIESEMARQRDDALASFAGAEAMARRVADHVRRSGRLLLLGMGASHFAGRIVAPLYRGLGVDAIAVPVSEQLTAPLKTGDKTLILSSQSGESAEITRWLRENAERENIFGLTLDADASLARALPSLVAAGGAEIGFAATRSLTLTLALHLAVLAALGEDPAPALAALRSGADLPVDSALQSFAAVRTVATSGRFLQGLAEALALGLTELARIPAFSLEGGQLQHGPLEMLGPEVGLLFVRCDEAGAPLIASAASSASEAGSPVVLLDASGATPPAGAVTLAWPRAAGLAAVFSMLPTAQRLMLGFAAARVANVGTPRRSAKITRSE